MPTPGGLIDLLPQELPSYRLSDTILQSALEFLVGEGFIQSYWERAERRGRPRRMYRLLSERLYAARELAHLWQLHTGCL
ncbi:helix-turn-helix transcriptional regulator [Neosynechococcus sphagnicola]|uniref:helix-turn-helix transcriptional regulator n=1 Tax=Neosynechococcus sphagnicola TaxID=1501145 RepID=UPI001EF9D8B8|nr:helix-turn-helix transcriptional regulator [Neosynechococcus sphagnicola]